MGSDFYFFSAKLMAVVLRPYTLFITAVALGFLLLFSRSIAHWGRRLLCLAVVGYAVLAVFPLGTIALAALEERFPAPPAEYASPVTGIIVLAGSIDTRMTRERGQISLNNNTARLTEFVRLARAYPQAKLLFSGGSGRVFDTKPTEAEAARRFFIEIGFDVSRIVFEDRSRNTSESARMAFETMQPEAGETWLLITSASHMPRAIGLYRHAGWEVAAHPVGYRTMPGAQGSLWPSWPGSLYPADAAAYEWGGLLVAWLRGSIDTPFPGPSPGSSQ